MFISVIIPVRDGGILLERCLTALSKTRYPHWECIVIEDGSQDDSAEIAYRHGARVLSGRRCCQGPAYARNIGAQVAHGDMLFFLDADVLVRPGTVGHIAATIKANPDISACFGSYDDTPTAPNFLSQYRNLLHHFVHQHGSAAATTFWSGCGAIRKDVFLAYGGFNNTLFDRPCIEDIELGYRLHAAGEQIRLEKLLLVTHMKQWTARQMVRTDFFDRALPWTRLIMQSNFAPNDLNLQVSQRVSTIAVFLLLPTLLLTVFSAWWLLLAAICSVTLFWLNRSFYSFLRRVRGHRFMLQAVPWHWFYFFYSGIAFAIGLLLYKLLGYGKEQLRSGPPAALTASPHTAVPPSPQESVA
jgi:glycosyltransferase involved in cell wall biosynthesis